MPYKNIDDRKEYDRKASHKKYIDPIKKEQIKEWNRQYKNTLDGRIVTWKHRAKKDKIEWNLTKEFIYSMPHICFYTGEALTCVANQSNTISLDRLDSSKGYIEGNVVFCSWSINRAKSQMPVNDFLDMCKKVTSHNLGLK